MDNTNPARSKLRIPNDAMYRLLREGCITEFNAKKASGETVRFTGVRSEGASTYEGSMPMGWISATVIFAKSDLRSVDFRNARLEGASINAAKISGAYFPADLTASEIELSLLHGNRMRYRSKS